MRSIKTISQTALILSASTASLLLAGCGVAPGTQGTTLRGVPLQGTVHGGQQPVSGATIQLYVAGSTGYSSGATYGAGTSLLGSNVVTSDANGNFGITGDYTCPSPSSEVYIVATGGDPGVGGSTNNSAIAMMAALGPCGNLSTSTRLVINELTTVGSVWALSQFMTDVSHLGASSTNARGISNAFASVNKLVDTTVGRVSGPALPAGANVPTARINTLANILASCINTGSSSSSQCATLFSDTTVGGVTPGDTIAAALNMARHPNLSVSDLAALSSPVSPFQPTEANPADFSLTVRYTGGALSGAKGIAMDSAGNAWIPNSNSNSVTKLDNTGAATLITAGSLNVPVAIAIDSTGSAWVTNSGNNTVSQIDSAGTGATVYSGGGLSTPSSIAIDASNNVWVANAGNNSITEISGSTLTSYTGSGIAAPAAIAINPK